MKNPHPFDTWELCDEILPPKSGQIRLFGFEVHQHGITDYAGSAVVGLLCMAAGISPAEFDQTRTGAGKPVSPAFTERTGFHYNMSHCGTAVLLAVAVRNPVGVDLELVRPVRRMETIVEYAFSQAEAREIGEMPAAVRQEAFFACWVRKEAVVKMAGLTIARNMDSFRVPTDPALRCFDLTPGPEAYSDDGKPISRCTVTDVVCGPTHRACVSVRGPKARVLTRRLDEKLTDTAIRYAVTGSR